MSGVTLPEFGRYSAMNIIVFLIVSVLMTKATFAEEGSFPQIENIAKHKSVWTEGDQTCGQGRNSFSYCEPAEDINGLVGGACVKNPCTLDCPERERKPDGSGAVPAIEVINENLLGRIRVDRWDNRGSKLPAYAFFNHPSCFTQPKENLQLGRSPSQFTLAVWVKQEYGNAGVIFEKVAKPGQRYSPQVVLSIMIGGFSLVMQYFGEDFKQHMKVMNVPIKPNEWQHLTIQVYGRAVSVFLNGVGDDGTPVLTDLLDAGIYDMNFGAIVKVGQRLQSTGQFVGRLQDYRWYMTALTNREIQEIYSGTFGELNIQSHCLCPAGYPRVHPLTERFCIPNGVPDTTPHRQLRLHEHAYPLQYLNDGDYSTHWISNNFYMRGGILLTIDLENGEYEVFNVNIQFWNPQPKMIEIFRFSNRTTDGNEMLWALYAEDCLEDFKYEPNGPLTRPDSVNCIEFPTEDEIPFINPNITFTLLSEEPFPRPGKDEYYESPLLMDFAIAEKVKLRMRYQYHTLRHDVDLSHQYYAIREVEVIGRCNCHGHAEACNMEIDPYECNCLPTSNTGGNMCNECLPLFNNKPFKRGTKTEAFNCQPCECNGHAESCHYDISLDNHPDDHFQGGGGRCDNCTHHTEGVHCELCSEFYFRMENVTLDDPNVCLFCNCSEGGAVNGTQDCEKIDGQCDCKLKVLGRDCSICMDGYFNLTVDNEQGCELCNCHLPGTIDRDFKCAQEGGQCNCKTNTGGRSCSECVPGFKNLQDSNAEGCESCDCHEYASAHQYCNSTSGNCKCKDNVEGMHCDVCKNGFWQLPDSEESDGCIECGCDESGTVPGTVCEKTTGQCVCKANTEGRTCDTCRDIYFNLTDSNEQGCENCHCDPRGTVNGSLVCDKTEGQCLCKDNVEGRVCNECKGNTFGLDWDLDVGCEPCDCDPTGTQKGDDMSADDLVCHATTGQCACVSHREGRQCDECQPEYYLPHDDSVGCLACDCHPYASTSDVCNNATGQCPCKEDAGVSGRDCRECEDTFWNFNHLFGSCEECACDEKGSMNDTCNAITGECKCKANVMGDKCDQCREGSSRLTLENPMGCYSHPEQQAPPIELGKTSSSIDLQWSPPDLPNGDELAYELYRNSELIYEINVTYPFDVVYYNDSELLPYTDYDYYIVTSNIGGSTESAEERFKTDSGIPTGVPPLEISDVRSTEATFNWKEPDVAHGPIEKYVLQSVNTVDDRHAKEHYSGKDLSVTIDDLNPFYNYTFTLRACTSGGCGDSMPLVVITPEAKPENQGPPSIMALSNSSLLIEWGRPDEPNGVLTSYKVLWRGKPDENGIHHPMQAVAFEDYGQDDPRPRIGDGYMALEQLSTNFTIDDLQPFTEYQFLVSSANSVGTTESSWETGRTLEGTPVFMSKPRAWAISSSQINITWVAPDPVTEIRGNVKMYQVVWVKQNTDTEYNLPPEEDVVLYSTGPKRLAYLAKNLDPYTDYTFFINLCNTVGCVKSERVIVKTLPAAPEDQSPPAQVAQDTNTISLSWELPGKVNGPHPDFTLFRSPVSFSRPPTEMSRGIRFPGHSFLRYSPEILPKDAAYSGIQLKFRTFQENALLFFAASKLASDYTRHEYLVIQLQDGRPWFLFDLQNSPTSATIDDDDIDAKYNDGKWHRIEVNRFEKKGFIELDGIFTGSATAKSHAIVYGVSENIFLAGLPAGYNVARPNDKGTMKVVTDRFVGCMKDVSVQRSGMLQEWSNVTFEDATESHRVYDSWQGCPDVLDGPAGHFLGRGYLKMEQPFDISNSDTWSIRMQIRPAFSSGIIFFAGGRKKNFVMGTLNNATLRFIVSMGQHQSHEMTFDPKELSSFVTLCDGNWHSVEFRNNRGTLTMTLDEHLQFGPTMDESFKGIDLSQTFFLGGVDEELSDRSSFLIDFFEDDGRSFGGCMRSFQLDLVEHSLITGSEVVYNVDLDGCPTGATNSHVLLGSGSWNQGSSGMQSGASVADEVLDESYVNSQNCEDGSLKVLHESQDMAFNSTGLHAFTQYLYRVMTSNDGGDTRSKWAVMRAGEGIPEKVGSPYDIKHMSGYAVEVFWRRPYHSNGVIVNYTLSAVSLADSQDGFNSSMNVTGEQYSGNVTGLEPWSQYEVYLSACTIVGCTKSIASLPFTTNQEAPYFVQKPSGTVTRSTMALTWTEPLKPNGIIVNYTLYHNNSKIYTGTRMRHTVRGLATFQQQRFKVEACTIAGCNMSKEVTIHSAQLPPGHVDPPMLRVLGPNSMSIEWLQPAVLNGIFDRYVIYVSNEQNTLGTPVYNSTEPQVETELHDLIAGMDYYVTLETCTGGGCKRSSQTFERTTESVPEDIPKTGVLSRSPFSFDVNWTAPLKPNGVIMNYTLFMDDMIMNVSSKPSSIHIEGLYPYGRHSFRVRVCTLKGCAYSPLAIHRTQERKPEGDVTVDVTVVDARSIDVKWNMPIKQNGVMSYRVYCTGQFFVDRQTEDFRLVYETRNLHIGDRAGEWTRIEGLLPYTDYMVQINASNSKGYIMSNMRTIRMPPGAPDGVMPPSLRSISPYELIATWTDPVRNNAPGNPYFQLQYRRVSPLEIETNAFDERTRQMSYSLKDLKPNEEYEFRLNAVNNYGNTYSEWVSASTQQTAPGYMAKPHIFDLDSTSMSLRWRPPTNPNGKIQSYTIYDADRLIARLLSNETYYFIEDLKPFTFYNYVIEVCTDGGCTRSDVTRVQTTAAAPEGLSPPDARSESPTSVFVTWKSPKVHNGILDNYILERRLYSNQEWNDSNSDVTLLGSFVPSQSLRYLDDATLLEPFTTYQYRVVSSTIGGGSTASNWTTVTTRPGRPAGIYSPTVTLLSPHSAEVEWEQPAVTNGPIIRYEVLFPEPRYTLEENATFDLIVEDLVAFTEYQVSVIACTEGGCSESPTTDITTDTTVPEHLDPPSAIPVSESYISVQWKPPKYPNGPGIFYELTRTKVSQPLIVPPPDDIDIPMTVYKGSDLSFQDRGLEMHTTFIYTLACFNIEGSVTSNATTVVTLGGIPLRAPLPRTVVLNHTSIRVVWDEPSIYDIQGEVKSYTVEFTAEGDSRRLLSLPPNETSVVLGNLHPGMIYSVQLTVNNGAHRVSSEIVEALTKDGAPEGVMPPVVYSLSASELHCSWLAPSNSNGEVIAYYMYVDNLKIDMHTDVPSSYVLSDLLPFTVYNLQIEACTKYACTKSSVTEATTQETLPELLENPIAKILGAREVEVTWIPPRKPNGILKSYEIHRRSIVPCKDIEPKDESKHCVYIGCKKNERPCGDTCYSPSTKVCCDGNIFFKSGGYECCGDEYIRSSTNSSDVCCAGKFYSAISTYQCCGNRYVQVLPGEVCCKDVVEDRVSVGAGDSCCGDVPYFSNGIQICCNSELQNGFEKKCCGNEVINSDKICCGTENARSYDAMQHHECCGNIYISRKSAVCCKDAVTGEESVHSFESNGASRNHTKCCSTQLIPSELNCCNGRGYDSTTHVCADFGTISSADQTMRCGSGTVCSINQTPSSFCDRCDFDIDRYDCYVSRGVGNQLKQSADHSSMCATSFMMVYTGSVDEFSFLDETVEPYTKYEYKLLVSNKMGFSESDTVAVTTFQSVPEGVEPPEWTSNSEQAIMLSWKEPKMPNGEIIKYALVRDGLEIWQGLAFAHTDSFQILSFRRYVYELKTCTYVGCSSSPQVFATSIQGIPTEVLPPLISVQSPTNISITWKHPPEANGLIIKYTLNETGVGTIFKIDPVTDDSSLSYVHSDLVPHSRHRYILTACTIAGCQSSKEVTATTFEDEPSGVWDVPAVLVINMTMAEIFWRPPEKPNGIIREYRLLRREVTVNETDDEDSLDQLELIYQGGPEKLNYTDDALQSGGTYEYVLWAVNSAGVGKSKPHTIKTPAKIPSQIPTLDVRVTGSNTVLALWSLTDDGDETPETYTYSVVVQLEDMSTFVSPRRRKRSIEDQDSQGASNTDSGNATEPPLLIYSVGKNQTFVVEKLSPYTLYRVRVRTCLPGDAEDVDCVTGEKDIVRTLPAPPEQQPPPTLKAIGPRAIDITWNPPRKKNGIITQYQIYRRKPDITDSSKVIFSTGDTARNWYMDSDEDELMPFETYEYRVRVRNSEGFTESDWAEVTTLQDKPEGIGTPSVIAISAFSVRVLWTEPELPNGQIVSYSLEYRDEPDDPTESRNYVEAITVPSSHRETYISGLKPFTKYEVRLVVLNSAGMEARSDWVPVKTYPAPPSGLDSFSVVAMEDGRSLLLTWNPPSEPNGEITTYNIYEVGYDTPLQTGLFRQFHLRRLKPYTNYALRLEACTGFNLCTMSPPQTFMTAQTVPELQPPPTISLANTTAVTLFWTRPKEANGVILSYKVIRNEMPRSYFTSSGTRARRSVETDFTSNLMDFDDWMRSSIFTSRGRTRIRRSNEDIMYDSDGSRIIYEVLNPSDGTYNYTDTKLKPYTKYEYKIRTSTSAGHIDSDWVTAETHQAAPTGLSAPQIDYTPDSNPTQLVIMWTLPEQLNGILQTFRVRRDNSTPFSFPANQFQFTDRGLKPYTVYSYSVTACTSGGCTQSDVNSERTLEEAPLFVSVPIIKTVNSSALHVTWVPPTITNGVIRLYQIFVDDQKLYEGIEMETTLTDLSPYTFYTVHVAACTSSGCRKSDGRVARTSEAPPQQMEAPELHVTSSRSIEVNWDPPMERNGKIVRYELRRNNELIAVTDGDVTRYHDFDLHPGTTYTYFLTAFNKVGHVKGDVAAEMTDPAAPAGLKPPDLLPTSSSSIHAYWKAPSNPNGIIVNFTLHIRNVRDKNDEKIIKLPGNVYEYVVRGLLYYQDYSFWLQCCTKLGCATSERAQQRTLEGIPRSLRPPYASLQRPDDVMLYVSWDPPSKPNGIITRYELYRRTIIETQSAIEAVQGTMVYNGSAQMFVDREMKPYTKYQYRVRAFNSAGNVWSGWSSVTRTGEAAPEKMAAPSFGQITERTVQVLAAEPAVLNGIIRSYTVYARRNMSSLPFQRVTTGYGRDQTAVSLTPFTPYEFRVEACTLEHLCLMSPSSYSATMPAAPKGQGAPQIVNIASTNVTLRWSAPTEANGIINSYEVHVRESCPPPYQPYKQECQPGPATISYFGISQQATILHLLPYQAYEFAVVSVNDYGRSKSEWAAERTLKTKPAYMNLPRVTSNISSIYIVWRNTFHLNSILVQFELTDQGESVYTGFKSSHIIRRTAAMVHEFQVKVTTDTGTAISPKIMHDTGRGSSIEVNEDKPKDTDDAAVTTASVPVYETIWFIAVIVLFGILLVFTALGVFLRRASANNDDQMKAVPPFPGPNGFNNGSSHSHGEFKLRRNPSHHSIHTSSEPDLRFMDFGEFHNDAYQQDWPIQDDASIRTVSDLMTTREKYPLADTHL